MKRIISYIISVAAAATLASCSFLDPLPDGTYTDENYMDYPKMVQGYVFKAYSLLPTSYNTARYMYLDCCTDDAVFTSTTQAMRQLSIGNGQPASYLLTAVWENDYTAINYCNRFLKDDIGLNTRYLLEPSDNAKLQKYLQGDAYALRAWYLFDLVKFFAGKGGQTEKDGANVLLGVPFSTDVIELSDFDADKVKRNTLDECIKQILSDCDNALKYLPEANRDFVVAPSAAMIDGAARYRSFDCVAVRALKALVYLYWASPMCNPSNDTERWANAAECAAQVIKYKLEVEGAQSGGFNPVNTWYINSHNDPEVIWNSDWQNQNYEQLFYPLGFGGTGSICPSQEFVDAFPMANGYPITDSRSGYDAKNPFAGRDPRFYSNVNFNGQKVIRGDGSGEVMYTFDTKVGGNDAPGMVNTSISGYYVKKFIYNLWNSFDKTVQTKNASIFFLRWTQMCLAFAEAANQAVGPTNAKYGLSAKDALAYIRNRTTQDGDAGLGVGGDRYLEECAAAGKDKFDELVKNEWRIETFLEGWRFINLRRWGASTTDLNTSVHGISITQEGSISHPVLETKKFPSQWLPLPYLDVRKCSNLVQNEGWDSWK